VAPLVSFSRDLRAYSPQGVSGEANLSSPSTFFSVRSRRAEERWTRSSSRLLCVNEIRFLFETNERIPPFLLAFSPEKLLLAAARFPFPLPLSGWMKLLKSPFFHGREGSVGPPPGIVE